MNNVNWIFGNYKKDFLWLHIPGIIAVVISQGFLPARTSFEFLLFAFVAKGFLDSGHVYTTVWRTYFHKTERQRLALYIYLPWLLFFMFFCWVYFDLPLLGVTIIYVTLFHNVRQFLGISKWYQKLNSRYDRISNFFLYANCILPIVVYHFRHLPGRGDLYYSGEMAFFHPDFTLEAWTTTIYFLNIAAWIAFETISLCRREWNRLSSVALPTLIYGTSFMLTSNEAAVIFPLVVSHGTSYLALNSMALTRTQKARFSKSAFAVGTVAVTALIFGATEFLFDDYVGDGSTVLTALVSALFLAPLFCHYIFDAFLWKRSHPESSLIYANPQG
jgi:hypothetical protein